MKIEFLTDKFIDKYEDFPSHMTELGKFVYYRTYSRWMPLKGRRETWKETCRRAVEYNISLAYKHQVKIGYEAGLKSLQEEAELLFHNMFNLRQFLSGRTLWIGGGDNGVSEKYPLANFNCSFINIRTWNDLVDLFYLLLVGTGVGFKCTKDFAKNLSPIRTNVILLSSEYKPVPKNARLEHSSFKNLENGYAKIYVGDSKEGWCEALSIYLNILTKEEYQHIHTVKISYNSVRPKGERLLTFGGTASGHEPLKEMFEGIDKVLKNKIDPSLAPIEVDANGYGRVRPIHILDIGNLIGANVVVGGVRRTAEIFLFDADDYECLFAKYGINGLWNEKQLSQHNKIGKTLEKMGIKPVWFDVHSKIGIPRKGIEHRRMSNNSICFTKKPSKDFLDLLFELMQLEGEPGFINLESARRRRPNAEGLNPCAEIILDSHSVCNLTTVNLMQFIINDNNGKLNLDYMALEEAQKMSARAGLRMTLTKLELERFDATMKRDRLLGCSLTGVQDAMALLGFDKEQEKRMKRWLKMVARNEADAYAKEMRVCAPLLVTTVKPEGTISQVCGGVSSGLHFSHSEYFIRRIRINADDPLADAVMMHGWKVHPEVGTVGETENERMQNARTLVIDFPVYSGSKKTKEDISALEQLNIYFDFQENYTEHNSSNTITVKPHEWKEVSNEIYNSWDGFVGVSFLAHDGGTYPLMPYETCSKDEYEALKASMKTFDPEVLKKFEINGESDLEGADAGCSNGVCPIR